MGKLKIAIFHLAFIYSGGGEKLVLEEAEGLKNLGYDVIIFTNLIDKKKCFPDIISKFQIRTFLPKLPLIIPDRDSLQILLTCILVPFFAFRFRKFDLILAANQPSSWIAWWVKKLFGVSYLSYLAQPTRVLYLREIDKKEGLVFSKKWPVSISAKLLKLTTRFVKWVDSVSIKDSNTVLANGEYIRKVLKKIYRIHAKSCPAGANPNKKIVAFKKRLRGKIRLGNHLAKKPYLLITNRHFAQKKLEYGIFILPFILGEFPNYSLVITGQETDYTQELKSLAYRLNLAENVSFLDYVAESDLEILYANAVVYLYTAPEEDFGMGIVEAMIAGTPVVAWDNAGPAKIVKNGETGFLVKPFEVFDFATCVLKIISDNNLAKKLSLKAKELVENQFSFQNHIKILKNTIKDVVKA